jgi:cAMP-dependent protein kinase regulator
MPKDVTAFMLEQLEKKHAGKGGGVSSGAPKVVQENEALKAELVKLKVDYRKLAQIDSQVNQPAHEPAAEEEDEEDDDDMIDEVEPAPVSSQKVRGSISAAAYGAWNVKPAAFVPPVIEKSDEQKSTLKTTLNKTFLFANVNGPELDQLIGAMKEVKVEEGKELIKQGDNGDFLFVVELGSLECWKTFPDQDEPKLVKTCEAGDVFGELSLMYNAPRAASVKSKVACTLWQLDAETFTHVVSESAAKSRNDKKAFLRKVDLLERLDDYELGQIADALKPLEKEANCSLFEQGDKGDMFYILEEGTAVAIKDGTEVMSYKAGQYFGELALMKNDTRAATIKTTSSVKLLTLPRSAFNRMLGSLEELMRTDKYS